ncbi:MAG: type II secretion system F family protein [Chloroflexi bacterium]|nr:type II secretion system F family protein [Chloroflexota bacterium]
MNGIMFGVMAVGVVILIVGFAMSRREAAPTVVEERMERYAEAGQAIATAEPSRPRERSSPLGERLNQLVQGRGFAGRIAADLAQADMKFTVGEYLALMAICAAGGVLLGIIGTALPDCLSSRIGPIGCLATRQYTDSTVAAIAGGLIGLFAPRTYVGFQRGARLQKFDNQLGDTLNLLVNSLRSGYSIMQAMEAVGKEQPPPISVEFKRIVQEMQLGLPMEQALDNLLRRIRSEDLDLVVTAINVQREVGGNLAEILDVISFTIRERVRIKGEIRVLTSQGMATGYAITGLPVGLGLLLFFVNRPYIMQFFSPENNTPVPCGWIMIVLGLILIAIGYAIIQKIVSIEV